MGVCNMSGSDFLRAINEFQKLANSFKTTTEKVNNLKEPNHHDQPQKSINDEECKPIHGHFWVQLIGTKNFCPLFTKIQKKFLVLLLFVFYIIQVYYFLFVCYFWSFKSEILGCTVLVFGIFWYCTFVH